MPQCPSCQQPLQRAHRKPIERTLSYVFPVMRYQCYNHACRWRGLRFAIEAHPLHESNRKPKDLSRKF